MAKVVQNLVQTESEVETELNEPRWAVISFDRREAGNLTYGEAVRLLAELDTKGVNGLCIVTDETASRVAA